MNTKKKKLNPESDAKLERENIIWIAGGRFGYVPLDLHFWF